ncbi:hypothetical protein P8452_05372 [Trifolium repens]|nr:putative R1/2-type MYB transcription factor [Trifolium repens]WJX15195.1 hypothetical protein P8452_05372 [Trifolium repens]
MYQKKITMATDATATMQWPTHWTREDIKIFERALGMVPEGEDCRTSSRGSSDSDSSNKTRHADKEKKKMKKGRSWTEDEHVLFLAGLEKYGKGDWRSISRHFVVTRTPTQVASHAQKYFKHIEQKSEVKNKKRTRSSIHDITLGDNNPATVPIDQNIVKNQF